MGWLMALIDIKRIGTLLFFFSNGSCSLNLTSLFIVVVYDGRGRVQMRRSICSFFINSNISVVTRSFLLCCPVSCRIAVASLLVLRFPSRAVSTVYAIQLYMKTVIPYHLWHHLCLTIVCQPHPYPIFMHLLARVDSSMKDQNSNYPSRSLNALECSQQSPIILSLHRA
jgi:hypothetical protein